MRSMSSSTLFMNSKSPNLPWMNTIVCAQWLTMLSQISFGIITAGWPMVGYWSSYFAMT